ncbi:MAG: agmatine deiminase family protein [Oligoflexales bacterium]
MSVQKSLIWLTIVTLSVACRSRNESRAKGHFEEFDASSLEQFIGKQAVIPEYVPDQSILISYLLLIVDAEGPQIVKEAFKAGVKQLYIVAPDNDDHPDWIKAQAKLTEILSTEDQEKVRLIRQPIPGTWDEWQDPSREQGPGDAERFATPWARDWAPLSAKTEDDELRFIDFNYFADRTLDDTLPTLLSKEANRTRISLPVYNEGGNFMISGQGDCFMSDRVIFANDEKIMENDEVLSRADIERYYKDIVGCKNVYVLPHLPDEPTQHIDMWAKFVNDETVLVGEIIQESLQYVGGTFEVLAVKNEQKYLNDQAEFFKSLGYSVVRIPMPLPINMFSIQVHRSYANSLLINKTAIVPRYRKYRQTVNYIDGPLLDKYEDAVKAVMEGQGYEVVFVNMDDLISYRGSVHCATMEIR